jgi:serine/threonine-protein kinase/endoribonuclease IRE1
MFSGTFAGQQVAIKHFEPSAQEKAAHEIKMLLQAGAHSNVVRLVAHEVSPLGTQIVLSGLSLQSLEDEIEGPGNGVKLEIVDRSTLSQFSFMIHQLLSGVAHLHSNGMVHTRLSPETVRVSPQGLQICCLGSATCVDHHLLSTELVSWGCPPELISGEIKFAHPTVDVFSVGCLVHYILTKGAHPFGKRSQRVKRITQGQPALPGLLAKLPGTANLVECAVAHHWSDRANISQLKAHVALWRPDQNERFLCELSDQLDCQEVGEIHACVEKVSGRVFGKDWSRRLEPWMRTDLFSRRGYKRNSMQDLLRAVRNKIRHCLTLPEEADGVITNTPEGVVTYFMDKFPRLVLEVHQATQNF